MAGNETRQGLLQGIERHIVVIFVTLLGGCQQRRNAQQRRGVVLIREVFGFCQRVFGPRLVYCREPVLQNIHIYSVATFNAADVL